VTATTCANAGAPVVITNNCEQYHQVQGTMLLHGTKYAYVAKRGVY